MFYSAFEHFFFIVSIIFTISYIAYVQFTKRSQHPIAMLCDHKRTQAFATQYLRVGIKGYLIFALFGTAFCVAVYLQMEWYAMSVYTLAMCIGMMIMTVRKFLSLDAADLAEAKHFMDYDLQSFSMRSLSIKRPR